MKKLSFLFAALVAGCFSAKAEFTAWVYDYESNVPHETQETWTEANLVDAAAGSANAIFSGKNGTENSCFDGKLDSRWIVNAKQSWVIYKFPSATKISAYGIRQTVSSKNGYDSRVPISWELYGSNAATPPTTVDDASWEKIDGRTSVFHNYSEAYNYDFKDRVMRLAKTAEYSSYLLKLSNNGDSYTVVGEIEFYHVISFSLEDCAATRKSDGSYTISGIVRDGNADSVMAYAKPDDETKTIEVQIGTNVAADEEVTGALSGLEDGLTYELSVAAMNGGDEFAQIISTAYAGELAISFVSNAEEKGAVPGLVKVSRANASKYPLTVNYVLTDGTAEVGKDYKAGSGVITIPANEKDGFIEVVPLVNPDKANETTLTVSLAVGNYAVPAEVVEMNIVKASLPPDKNVWVAGSTSDGLASTASNWSKGVPTADNAESLVILVDGNYSSHDLTWDAGVNGLADTVASWTQTESYAGTVTINTTYPVAASSFKTLTVTGAMAVDGGTLTHPLSVNKDGDAKSYTIEQIRSAYTYRLNIEAGSFALGAGAKIDLVGKGMSRNRTTAKLSTLAPVHGGQYENSPVGCYGNPKYPEDIGWAGNVVSDRTQNHAAGGGAFKLKSAGDVIVNGEINVDGEVVFDTSGGAAGAAGSVLIEAKSVSGSGRIHADGLYNQGKDSAYDGQNGAGGRIAILTTEPVDLTTLAVSASAETCGVNGKKAQAGTVYVKDALMNKGVLYVRNLIDVTGTAKAFKRATSISGDGDWSFDRIVLSGNVQLFVPEGKSLSVPAFEDIACPDATRTASLFVKGSLGFAKAPKYTLSGNWNFAPLSEIVFDGDLEVKDGANLGVAGLSNLVDSGSELPDYASIKVKVNGDMTIAESGMMAVVGGGVVKYNNTLNSGRKGVLPDATHGGRIYAYVNNGMYAAYDSVFAPHLPGNAVPNPNGQYADQSAGVITLVVSGALTVDGSIDANGSPADYDQGANCAGGVGGAIDITAGSLLGSGEIRADGGCKPVNRGAGGRVAVKLTDKAADFSAYTGNISAGGRVRQQSKDQASNDSSAGTIYLQTGAEGEKEGTIRIAQRQSARTKKDVINGSLKVECDEMYAAVSATTEIVSLGYGGDQIDDYEKAKVEVRDFGHAAVNADVKLSQMTVATADASVDLEGHTLTVVRFVYFNGSRLTRLATGTYTAEQLAALGVDCVRDSVGGGSLVVTGMGLAILVW